MKTEQKRPGSAAAYKQDRKMLGATPAQWSDWQRAAGELRVNLSTWIRSTLDAEIRRGRRRERA